MDLTATICVERPVPVTSDDVDDTVELEIEVTGSAVPFVAGRYHGAPENCYPDEGGHIDDLCATFNGQPIELLTEAEVEYAQEVLQMAADAARENAMEAMAEARAEAMAECDRD